MLKESRVAKLKFLPEDAIKIEIGHPSIFAPSETLLSEFNEIKWRLMKKGMAEPEARKRAWKQTGFEKRFREQIESKPNVVDRLKEIRSTIPTQHTMTILGFSMNLGPMKYIGPVIITLLFLYYFLHLSYVEKKKPNIQIIEYFPWIAIYKGKLPVSISWFITFILPSLSVVFIFFGFYTQNFQNNLVSFFISIISISILIWMAIFTNKILTSLRNVQ